MALTASLEIRIGGILSLAFSEVRLRVGVREARSGEAVRVAPGRVRVRIEGRRLLPDRRYDLALEFETDVAPDSRVTVEVPSRRVTSALERVNVRALEERLRAS